MSAVESCCTLCSGTLKAFWRQKDRLGVRKSAVLTKNSLVILLLELKSKKNVGVVSEVEWQRAKYEEAAMFFDSFQGSSRVKNYI